MSGDVFKEIIKGSPLGGLDQDAGSWGADRGHAGKGGFVLECVDVMWQLLEQHWNYGAENGEKASVNGVGAPGETAAMALGDRPNLEMRIIQIAERMTRGEGERLAKIALFRAYLGHPASSEEVIRILLNSACDEIERMESGGLSP